VSVLRHGGLGISTLHKKKKRKKKRENKKGKEKSKRKKGTKYTR
jgi:hypothetical protein